MLFNLYYEYFHVNIFTTKLLFIKFLLLKKIKIKKIKNNVEAMQRVYSFF